MFPDGVPPRGHAAWGLMALLQRGYFFVAALLLSAGGAASACGGGPTEPDDGAAGAPADSGGDGSSADGCGLRLESSNPTEGEANADAFAPIELVFDAAIDVSTLEAVTLQADGEPLDFEISAKDKTLTIAFERPALPAKVSLSISGDLKSEAGQTFCGDSYAFTYPFWQNASAQAATSTNGLGLVTLSDRSLVLITSNGDDLSAQSFAFGTWKSLDPPPMQGGANPTVVGAVVVGERVFLVWLEGPSTARDLYAATLEDGQWDLLSNGPVASGSGLIAAVSLGNKTPLIAAQIETGVRVFGFDDSAGEFLSIGSDIDTPDGGLSELSVAGLDDAAPVVAGVDADHDIVVWRRGGTVWLTLDPGIDRARSSAGPVRPQIVAQGQNVLLSYLDGDAVSLNVQVARFKQSSSQWAPLGAALDVELDGKASLSALAIDADGIPTVAWVEEWIGAPRLFAARLEAGDDWRVLGMPLDSALPKTLNDLVLSLDASGFPSVAIAGDDETRAYRFNGSPSLPRGLPSRGDRGACDIPAEVGVDFPAQLSDTGCYESLSARTLVSAAIPYNLNSILWSDGAIKRRYLLLPEKGTIDFEATGALGMPVGTIIIKEFDLEKTVGNPNTLFPVETRFLVKRCEEGDCAEPWQGYTYKWNTAGSDATLVEEAEGATSQGWSVTDDGAATTHTHLYPSRDDCVRCHNPTAGRVLGLDAPQLDRPQEYGGVVDNQLRAWQALGLFGGSADLEPQVDIERLPSPPDVGRSLTERTLSYFDGNCSHCHHAGGENIAIDYRYFDGPGLTAGNICNKLVADHENSLIYVRDSTRPPLVDGQLGPMPPIATDLPDTRQLTVTAAWIDSLSACP